MLNFLLHYQIMNEFTFCYWFICSKQKRNKNTKIKLNQYFVTKIGVDNNI